MADATLSDIVEEVSSEDGVRTVKVEITHKHEERSSGTTWAIGLGIVLILSLGLFYAADKSGVLGSDSDDVFGCSNGEDDDGGGRADDQDPDCWTAGQYQETNSESDPTNDLQSTPNP